MRNPCQQVSYEEIAGWFKQGQSSKGKNRGLGLYYAKKLCHRFGGIISYEKMELEGLHWIELGIEIQKHRDKR
jgi:sensor histidine kinase regulating citrate/malate metabolism